MSFLVIITIVRSEHYSDNQIIVITKKLFY